MRANHMKSQWGRATALAGFGALLFTYGCSGAGSANGVRAQELTAGQAGTPVVVSCEPHQRTLVRPGVVNGAAVSQVECVAADPSRAYATQAAFTQEPVAQPVGMPVEYGAPVRPRQVVYEEDVQPARVIRTSQPARVVRPARTSQVVYEPVKKTRSVKKSAIIIGSSAGVGAGVGAAVGGKKGALIGAVVGGGGAAVWDQVTRRK